MRLLILSLFIYQCGLAQKTADSLLREEKRLELKGIAFDLQNKGQLLDEQAHKFSEAATLIDSAIRTFEILRDSINIANNLKFYGYLLARKGNYIDSKAAIKRSIEIFEKKGALWGVAVSHFDMARVYYFENNTDSAVSYSNSAINFWRQKKDTDRVFINQNLQIATYLRSKNYKVAKEIQQLNLLTSQEKEQHWQNLLDFYTISFYLFRECDDLNKSNYYKSRVGKLKRELAKREIEALSFFE